MKISKFSHWTQQVYQQDKQRWKVTSLIAKSADLPVQVMPIEHLNIVGLHPLSIASMRDWVGHIKSVLASELKYPIILDDEGSIMDGRHRVAKALLEGKASIKFVRFKETPTPDFYENEEE